MSESVNGAEAPFLALRKREEREIIVMISPLCALFCATAQNKRSHV